MDILISVYNFVVLYWAEIVAVFTAVNVIAIAIVNATPNQTDNAILDGVRKVLVIVANIIPNTKPASPPK
jgi:hypothetical protein